jgi:hypothetical protein
MRSFWPFCPVRLFIHQEVMHMATYAQLASKLLRDAATFFRNVGEQNAPLKEQMNDNATVYEQVADLLEKDPNGILDLGEGE